MTKEDIKKALEICADISIPCNDCPYDALGNCTDTLCADALNLITEQEKEFERLKDDYAKLQEQFAKYQMASDKEIMAQRKHAQIDVLNELKKYLHTEDFDTPDERWKPESEFCAIIDKIIKEVQNAEDKG